VIPQEDIPDLQILVQHHLCTESAAAAETVSEVDDLDAVAVSILAVEFIRRTYGGCTD